MACINLTRIINKKEVLAIVEGLIAATGANLRVEDVYRKRLLGTEDKEVLSHHPIKLLEEIVGWVVHCPTPDAVNGEEQAVAIAAWLSYWVKQEFEKKSLANELLEKYQEIDLFYDIATQITASLELQEVAQLVIEEAGKLIESTGGAILLLHQKINQFQTLSTFGQIASEQDLWKLGEEIIHRVIQTGRGEIINDVVADSTPDQEPVNSLICAPLKTKNQVIGVIFLWSCSVSVKVASVASSSDVEVSVSYTAGDLKLLNMFAVQTAVAIEKALLYEESCTAAIAAQTQAQQIQQALHDLQQTQAQLIQSEKMSNLGQLVAGVAHEINNPINFISGNLRPACDYIQDLLDLLHLYQQHYSTPVPEIQVKAKEVDFEFLRADLPKLLASMRVGVDRIRQIVLSLRNFSRTDQAEATPVSIHEGIDSTLLILNSRLEAGAKNGGIQVVKEYGELPLVKCFASQLNQVFMNIISNAIDAIEHQPQRIITIRTEVLAEDIKSRDGEHSTTRPTRCPSVVIRIRDNGSGMSEAIRSQIFETFFTTKPIGKGTGLGLSISHQIVVEKHGGVLKCFSQPGDGTEFWIQIPVEPWSVCCCQVDSPRDHQESLTAALASKG